MKISGAFSRLAALGAAMALSLTFAQAAETGKATVTGVRGVVTIGSTEAKTGADIPAGTTITTGISSQLDIDLGVNGPNVQVHENTQISIDELTFDNSGAEPVINTKLSLKQGRVAGFVKKTSAASSYTISTPTTTAAIRGTTYLVSADGHVWVWDGCVEVQFKNPQTMAIVRYNVCAGQMFDPNVPGVLVNDLPPPVLPPIGPPTTTPVGPIINVSPVKPATTAPVTPPED
jgi:hypothetical protein